jgi:hypothetical protein
MDQADPSPPPPAPPAVNRRRTALTGSVLLALVATQALTLFDVGAMIVPHIFVGLLFLVAVVVKLVHVGVRFVRYYAGDPDFRAEGPPATPARVLAPVLVAVTLVLLGSGVGLVLIGGSVLLRVHLVSFLIWVLLGVGHLLLSARNLPELIAAPQNGEVPNNRDDPV